MTPDQIDFSVDYQMIKNAEKMLIGNRQVTPKQAFNWIHSPVKELWERSVIGGVGSILSFLPSRLFMGRVYLQDGFPVSYDLKVGFLGNKNQIIGLTDSPKIRTLRTGVAQLEEPFESSAFLGSRKRAPAKELRTFSPYANWLRNTRLDELPQFKIIRTGKMAGIGVRGWTIKEISDLKKVFADNSNSLPDYLREDYQREISSSELKPAAVSLQSATLGKDLTVSERMLLDLLYIKSANFVGDWMIVLATVKTHLKGTGVR